MRFQASWIIEALHPERVDSIFFPVSPGAEKLLWFKRQGHALYANDPLDSRYVFLKALLENPGESFSDANKRKFNQVLKNELDISLNPYRTWEPAPFSRRQIDYLFYWHEAALEIEDLRQRNIFYCAVASIMNYWLDMKKAGFAVTFAPDEIMGYALFKIGSLLVKGNEPVFSLHVALDDLSETVEASLCVIPLLARDKSESEPGNEDYFHAWFHGFADLGGARKAIHDSRSGWMIDWQTPPATHKFLSKVGKARQVAFCWSAADLPPRAHQETIWEPLKKTFAARFPHSRVFFKTADRYGDEYDFLGILRS
jgi:hypothetical protein